MGSSMHLEKNKKFSRYFIVTLAVTSLFIYFLRQSHGQEKFAPESLESTATVSVIVANTKILNREITFSGPIVGREEVPVYGDTTQGRIVQLLADDGQLVKVGQPLAILDSTLLKTQKMQQEAMLQHAMEAVLQQETLVEEAKAQHEQAKAEKLRAEAIAESGLLSGEALEQRLTAERLADTHIKAAQSNLGIAQADLALSKGQLAETEVKIHQSTVIAPVSGTIIERKARIGLALGQSADPLFVILKDNVIEVEFSVSGTELVQLKAGLKCNIQLIGDTGTYPGKIRHVASKIDRVNQTAKVRVAFDQQPKAIIGQTARVSTPTRSKEALYLPDTAIRFEGVSAFVYVVKNNKAILTKVLTGNRIGNMLEVTHGIDAGMLIVDRASAFLHDGQSVTALLSKSPQI